MYLVSTTKASNFFLFAHTRLETSSKSVELVTGFPVKDARLLKHLNSIFSIFYLPYHHLVVQEYFSNVRLFGETLYLN